MTCCGCDKRDDDTPTVKKLQPPQQQAAAAFWTAAVARTGGGGIYLRWRQRRASARCHTFKSNAQHRFFAQRSYFRGARAAKTPQSKCSRPAPSLPSSPRRCPEASTMNTKQGIAGTFRSRGSPPPPPPDSSEEEDRSSGSDSDTQLERSGWADAQQRVTT